MTHSGRPSPNVLVTLVPTEDPDGETVVLIEDGPPDAGPPSADGRATTRSIGGGAEVVYRDPKHVLVACFNGCGKDTLAIEASLNDL